ncbi:MAG: HEPN domain-containing protein [Treponema sp.]|jgi:HEPN domain-containing protein|nr:HEPN domain-containing protein [Treponema sp.]
MSFAEKDLLTVSEIIERPELTNIVTFHCQQAIEKYFKAYITGFSIHIMLDYTFNTKEDGNDS